MYISNTSEIQGFPNNIEEITKEISFIFKKLLENI